MYPSVAYYQYILDFFRTRFCNSLLIVTSDNISWCKEHLDDNDVVYLPDKDIDPRVRLAVSVLCNATVQSTTAFSLWSNLLRLQPGMAVQPKGWYRSKKHGKEVDDPCHNIVDGEIIESENPFCDKLEHQTH